MKSKSHKTHLRYAHSHHPDSMEKLHFIFHGFRGTCRRLHRCGNLVLPNELRLALWLVRSETFDVLMAPSFFVHGPGGCDAVVEELQGYKSGMILLMTDILTKGALVDPVPLFFGTSQMLQDFSHPFSSSITLKEMVLLIKSQCLMTSHYSSFLVSLCCQSGNYHFIIVHRHNHCGMMSPSCINRLNQSSSCINGLCIITYYSHTTYAYHVMQFQKLTYN